MGTEIFPDVKAPLLQIRLPAPAGTRIEQTEPMVLKALDVIGQAVGSGNVTITSDYVGTQPASYPVDLIYLFTAGPQEAVVRVALKNSVSGDESLREHIRSALRRSLPQMQVSFEAGDIISQVMSFGSPTPVNIAVQGPSLEDNYAFAQKIRSELARLPFLRDRQFAQAMDYPAVNAEIDRDRAGQFGLTMSDIVQSYVAATASSRFTAPNYWRDPKTGNAFQVQIQYPQHRMQSLQDLKSIPVTLRGLRIGFLLAVVVIFLLLTANFQSLRLSLAVILTTPAVLCGVLIMLRITGTTLNVQSFIGAIMAVGIAVANSILLVSFAERSCLEHRSSSQAAHDGAASRLRAILMTAAAMICGMLRMALGLGQGGNQTAPLARAVIGGLLFSTFATLTFLPAMYSILQQKASAYSPSLNPDDPYSRYYEQPQNP